MTLPDDLKPLKLITAIGTEAGVATLKADSGYDTIATIEAIEGTGCETRNPPKANLRAYA